MDCSDIYEYTFSEILDGVRKEQDTFSTAVEQLQIPEGSLFEFENLSRRAYFYNQMMQNATESLEEHIVTMLILLLDRYSVPYEIGPVHPSSEGERYPILDPDWGRTVQFITTDNKVTINSTGETRGPLRWGFAVSSDPIVDYGGVRPKQEEYTQLFNIVLNCSCPPATPLGHPVAKIDFQMPDGTVKLDQPVIIMPLRTFFLINFPEEEYEVFLTYASAFNDDLRSIIGLKIIDLPTDEAVGRFIKGREEVILAEAESYRERLAGERIETQDIDKLFDNYIGRGLYKAMTGGSTFADSYISSEWYYSIHEATNAFDQTGIVAGYLKSVEQLLYAVASLVKDEPGRTMRARGAGGKFVPFTTDNEKKIDKTLGSLNSFFRYKKNWDMFEISDEAIKMITDTVDDWRIKQRNGYFHADNLHDTTKVDFIRHQAMFLYFLILGGCAINDWEFEKLGIGKRSKREPTASDRRRAERVREEEVWEDGIDKDLNENRFTEWFVHAVCKHSPRDRYLYSKAASLQLDISGRPDGGDFKRLTLYLLAKPITGETEYAEEDALAFMDESIYRSALPLEDEMDRIEGYLRSLFETKPLSSLIPEFDRVELIESLEIEDVYTGKNPMVGHRTIESE